MKSRLEWFRSLQLWMLICVLGCGVPSPVTEPRGEKSPAGEPPPDLIQPKLKRVRHDQGYYKGVVTAVGLDWLELGAGWEGETGRKRQQDHKKPKRISAAGTRPGGNPDGEGEEMTHRVSDLKVGDVVRVQADISRGGEEWTGEISMERRPGGKIPPYYGDQFTEKFPFPHLAFHLRNQAEQDWEEKGVPIPVKYLGSSGRAPWTNPPYPPVAPEPRFGVTRTDAPTPREKGPTPIPPAKQ